MFEHLKKGAYNINRGNYEGAYDVADMVLDTRELLAELFHAEDSRHVIFTPGITWSLNMFLKGFLKPGDHVLTTSMEHNAVMRPLTQLRKIGVTYDMVPANAEGTVAVEEFVTRIRENTKAIIVLHASNVCGTVMPIREIGAMCKEYGLFFAVDTAQSAGTIPVDMQLDGIDFLAFTGHKGLLGPQGIGGFIISECLNREMEAFVSGGTGSQSDLLEVPEELPDKYESGTMNLPGIAGLHAALLYLKETGVEEIHRKKMELTEYFLQQVKAYPTVRVIGKKGISERVAVVSLDFIGRDNGMIAFELEQKYGIMTRVGLHCAPMAHQSLNTFPEGTVRFAFGVSNKKEEIDVCMRAFREMGC
ncbi:aminotransferase class V-fold PLP-dependent enzyme [Coprococcus sp. AF21-14LB]|uniref:aminotransferase class V-fold PLP-dependent enzyme n=1 Tax=Coprococcus sp. AF21-14LB TaxID=2292231 RepID=UPI0026B01B77